MRRALILFFFALVSSATLLAGSLNLRIVDPDQRAVSSARVLVYSVSGNATSRSGLTLSDGTFSTSDLPDGAYRVQVLAPGFAEATRELQVPSAEATEIALRVGTWSETVIVSGASTPISEAESGAAVSIIDNRMLELRNPATLDEAVRYAPGVYTSSTGQRGSQTSLFVRGGESRYNKVIVDGVSVTEPGGGFNLGVVSPAHMERIELVRGSESAIYGSDAMSSVLQTWSATGRTPIPELRLGADGGNFGTGHGYASLAGAWRVLDYNLFGDQFNTNGQGPNSSYSNGLQGANVGVQLHPRVQLRLRTRHSNSFTGVSDAWSFNGTRVLPVDRDQYARQNSFLANLDLTIASPGAWQHRFGGSEYHFARHNVNAIVDPERRSEYPFNNRANYNRADFHWQSDYTPRSWTRSSFGYNFQDENGSTGATRGLRFTNSVFFQQMLLWKRFSLLGGFNYVHGRNSGEIDGTYLSRAVPRVALTYVLRQGNDTLGSTRLRGVYSEGIVEPGFVQSFGLPGTVHPNLDLKAEQVRTYEAGFEQGFLRNRLALSAAYFRSHFRDQINFNSFPDFTGQYININKALAHGAEVELHAELAPRISWISSYTYTSTQILDAPLCTAEAFCDLEIYGPGRPLLRRPHHLGSTSINYTGTRWGANLSGFAIGRRPDSDFIFKYLFPSPVPPFTYAAGYARVDLSGYYVVNSRVTWYANLENLLNNHHNEVVGYPALGMSFRSGLRFRLWGD